MNMLSKMLFMLFLSLLIPSEAYASEGQFTLVPRGGMVPFEATCFDSEATARLLTWKEFLEEQERAKCEYEKQKLILDSELVISNMQITLDETQIRYQVEIDTRDREIQDLRDIIKKNKKVNIPAVIAASVAVGFGVGVGTYYLASK